jgi:mRNA-degrading endonuclease RelE of RelBE toxin-antitoxin system
MINYQKTKEFERDSKKLLKSFSSLRDDFRVNKQYRIELFHEQGVDNNGIFCIEGVSNTDDLKFYKVKKFSCKSLKGRGAKSGIRIVYAYLLEEQKIVFLEIYFKGKQKNNNIKRITDFIKIYEV